MRGADAVREGGERGQCRERTRRPPPMGPRRKEAQGFQSNDACSPTHALVSPKGEAAASGMAVRTALLRPCALRLTPLSHSERASHPPRVVHDWSQRQEPHMALAGTVAAVLRRAAALG
jgi:hypothetical protein